MQVKISTIIIQFFFHFENLEKFIFANSIRKVSKTKKRTLILLRKEPENVFFCKETIK